MKNLLKEFELKSMDFQRFSSWLLSRDKKKTLFVLCILLIFSVIFSVSMGQAQKKIRRSELHDLVSQKLDSKHLIPLEYGDGDKKITDSKAISIMFSQPDGRSFHNVLKILDTPQQEEELNRNFYYYPIVYDSSDVAKKYNIDPANVTFVFFEKGKEKNRFVVEKMVNLNKEFIPALNRLPMWRLSQQENQK